MLRILFSVYRDIFNFSTSVFCVYRRTVLIILDISDASRDFSYQYDQCVFFPSDVFEDFLYSVNRPDCPTVSGLAQLFWPCRVWAAYKQFYYYYYYYYLNASTSTYLSL